MALPTITVTPGTGLTVNTLPSAGPTTTANSLPVALATDDLLVAKVSTAAAQASILTAIGTPLQAGGTVTANAGTGTFAVSAAALPLPSGAATAAGVTAIVTALGTPAQAGGNITNITGSISLPTGASTAALQTTGNTSLATLATNSGTQATAALQGTINTSLTQLHADMTAATPAGANIIGKVGIDQTTGQNVVVIPALKQQATSTPTSVAAATTSVQLLAANTNRLGGTIVNESTSAMTVTFGTAATATNYSYYLAGSASGVPAQLEIPQGWTGLITGMWATATGNARITERT